MTSDLLPAAAREDPQLDESARLESILRFLDLDPALAHRLRHCERETTVTVPAGEIPCVAQRVRHIAVRGISRGPMLMAASLLTPRLRLLAQAMTWQLTLLGIPAGGSAGVFTCDPRQLPERDLRTAVEHATRLLWDEGDSDLVAGGADPQALLWMAAACRHPRAICRLSGWPVHPTAHALCALLEQSLGTLAGKQVAIQGLGRVGLDLIALVAARGARVVAVADASGGAVSPAGLDATVLRRWMDAHGLLFGFDGAEPAANAQVLECPCDALVLAAAERQVHAGNASRVQASLVAEARLGAVTPAAADLLSHRAILHIPGLVGAAAPLLAAWMEWTGAGFWASPGGRVERLSARLVDGWARVRHYATAHRLSTASGALQLAIEELLPNLD